jgi:predicted GTPase
MNQKIRLTVLICGQTGTGKSSIANFRLKNRVAEVGNSAESIRKGFPPPRYENDDIVFYDSDGYETGKTEEYKENIFSFLSRNKDFNGVHLVWYTINSAGHRFTDFDFDIVNKIQAQGFAVGILLTKIDECDEIELSVFVAKVRQSFAGKEIFRVSTKDDTELNRYVQSHFCDWDNLIKWTEFNFKNVIEERLQEVRKQAKIAIGGAMNNFKLTDLENEINNLLAVENEEILARKPINQIQAKIYTKMTEFEQLELILKKRLQLWQN